MPRGYSTSGGGVDITGVHWPTVAAALRDGPKEIRLQFNRDTRDIARPIMGKMRNAVEDTSASATSTSSSRAQYGRATWAAMRGRSGPLTFNAMARYGGGLRASVGRTLQLSRRAGGQLIGLRIDANTGRMPAGQRSLPAYMDQGHWRHPVLGNRNAWVTQTVSPAGWFTHTAIQSLPIVRAQSEQIVDRALEQIADRMDAAG